jgi:hypothetical protein
MKTIKIEKVGENQSYLDLIKISLDNPPEKGFDLTELKTRMRVDEAVSKRKDDVISLEDADFVTLKKCASAVRWGMRKPELIKFLELFQ